MHRFVTICKSALAAALLVLAMRPAGGKELFEVPLENPSFTGGVNQHGVPLGWSQYGGGGKDQELKIGGGPDGRKATSHRGRRPRGRDWRVPDLRPERRRNLSGHGEGPGCGRFLDSGRLPAVTIPAFKPTGPDGSDGEVRRRVLRGLGQGHGPARHHPRCDLLVHASRPDSPKCSSPTSDLWAVCRRRLRLRLHRSLPSTTNSRTCIVILPWSEAASRTWPSWHPPRVSTGPRPRPSNRRSRSKPE